MRSGCICGYGVFHQMKHSITTNTTHTE